ncbi:MAG: histone H1-like repetitive region-containing protein, partial [Planctomycetota bacterium]
AKKALAKKALAKKALAKMALAKKVLAKMVLAKKVLAKRVLAKRVLAKRALAKRALAKKVLAKKVLAKKALAKKALAKKALAKKALAREERMDREPKMLRANHLVPRGHRAQVTIVAERTQVQVERLVAEGRRPCKVRRKRIWNTPRKLPTWFSTTSIANAINPILSCCGGWDGLQTT